jgi:hypothetical protein
MDQTDMTHTNTVSQALKNDDYPPVQTLAFMLGLKKKGDTHGLQSVMSLEDQRRNLDMPIKSTFDQSISFTRFMGKAYDEITQRYICKPKTPLI